MPDKHGMLEVTSISGFWTGKSWMCLVERVCYGGCATSVLYILYIVLCIIQYRRSYFSHIHDKKDQDCMETKIRHKVILHSHVIIHYIVSFTHQLKRK